MRFCLLSKRCPLFVLIEFNNIFGSFEYLIFTYFFNHFIFRIKGWSIFILLSMECKFSNLLWKFKRVPIYWAPENRKCWTAYNNHNKVSKNLIVYKFALDFLNLVINSIIFMAQNKLIFKLFKYSSTKSGFNIIPNVFQSIWNLINFLISNFTIIQKLVNTIIGHQIVTSLWILSQIPNTVSMCLIELIYPFIPVLEWRTWIFFFGLLWIKNIFYVQLLRINI